MQFAYNDYMMHRDFIIQPFNVTLVW